MVLKNKPKGSDDLEILLTFLKRTKEGKYAPIEEISLLFARIREETELIEAWEEEYYYSIS